MADPIGTMLADNIQSTIYWLKDQSSRSFMVVLGGHALRLILGLVSSVILARGLGAAGLGVFSIVGAGITIAATIADFGLRNSAVKHIASSESSQLEKAQQIARIFARLKLAGAAILTLVILITAETWVRVLGLPAVGGRWLVWAGAVAVFARAFSTIPASILQALNHFGRLVLAQTSHILLSILILGGLFLAGSLTIMSGLIVGALTTLVTGILGWGLLPATWRRILIGRVQDGWSLTRELLGFSFWVWISSIFVIVYFQLDLLMLNRISPGVITGHYALAFNLSGKATILVQTMHIVLLPVASALSSRREISRYLGRSWFQGGMMSGLLLATIPLARPFIVAVYGFEFEPAALPYYVLIAVVVLDLGTLPVLLLAYPLGRPWLITLDNGLRVLILVLSGGLLITGWGLVGAAMAKLIAKSIASLVVAILIMARLRRLAD